MPVQIAGPLHGEVSEQSYTLPQRLSYTDWASEGPLLQQMAKASKWWLGDWLLFGQEHWSDEYAQALPEDGPTRELCQDAMRVCMRFLPPSRIQGASFDAHRDATNLAHHSLRRAQSLLRQSVREGWTARQRAANVRAAVAEYNVHNEEDTFGRLETLGVFNVILADPPWRYDFAESGTREVENQYPTMTVEDICAMSVPAADDAVLFMWATSPKLPQSMQVLDAWGFDYKTNAVWVKHAIGMGYYFRQRHELLLVARKGEMRVPQPARRPDSVIESPRTQHSEKPPCVYEIIERMYPRGIKLELFARNARDGWTAWGNQVQETA